MTRMNVSMKTTTMIMNGVPAADNDIAEKRLVLPIARAELSYDTNNLLQMRL